MPSYSVDLTVKGLYHFDAAQQNSKVAVSAHGIPSKWTGKIKRDGSFEESEMQLHMAGPAVLQFQVWGTSMFRLPQVLATGTIASTLLPENDRKELRIELAGQPGTKLPAGAELRIIARVRRYQPPVVSDAGAHLAPASSTAVEAERQGLANAFPMPPADAPAVSAVSAASAELDQHMTTQALQTHVVHGFTIPPPSAPPEPDSPATGPIYFDISTHTQVPATPADPAQYPTLANQQPAQSSAQPAATGSIPGLWASHVHLLPPKSLAAYLAGALAAPPAASKEQTCSQEDADEMKAIGLDAWLLKKQAESEGRPDLMETAQMMALGVQVARPLLQQPSCSSPAAAASPASPATAATAQGPSAS